VRLPDNETSAMSEGGLKAKAKGLWDNITKADTSTPLAIGTEGKAECPSCEKMIDFSQYSNQRGDEINAGNAFSCPHCSQLLLRWEPDSARSHCAGCNVKFFSFRSWNDIVRKHHCRMCGKIYCSECLNLCRVAGFGWEVHGNWIKLKLCGECEKENEKKQEQLDKEKEAAEAEAAMAEVAITEEPAASVSAETAADNSTASNTSYDADTIAALKEDMPAAKPQKRQSRLQPQKTSIFDDDISFIHTGGSKDTKKEKKKEKKNKQLDLFEGENEKQGGLFDD